MMSSFPSTETRNRDRNVPKRRGFSFGSLEKPKRWNSETPAWCQERKTGLIKGMDKQAPSSLSSTLVCKDIV